MTARQWDRLAYCARYGHQPLSELRRLSMTDLGNFQSALSRLVERENARDEET